MNTVFEEYKVISPATGIEFTVKIELDEYPDLSWLGEYTSRVPDNAPAFVDRKAGLLLLNESEYDTWSIDSEHHAQEFADELRERYYHAEVDVFFDDDNNSWIVDMLGGNEILAEVSSSYERRSYEYWIPCNNHFDGVLKEDAIRYTLEDYKRLEGYIRGNWYMTGIIVSIVLDGEEVVRNSIWGVESDWKENGFTQEDFNKEYIYPLMEECLDELKGAAQHYSDLSEQIKELLP